MRTSGVGSGSIVVGIDGTVGSDRALAWAARRAHAERRPLTVVHSCHLSVAAGAVRVVRTGRLGIDEMAVAGHVLLDAADLSVRGVSADLEVRRCLELARDPRQVLLDLARHASVVVVGSRGRGRVTGALLGSVGRGVVRHAACDVVVVRRRRTTTHRDGAVVVAEADGSTGTVVPA